MIGVAERSGKAQVAAGGEAAEGYFGGIQAQPLSIGGEVEKRFDAVIDSDWEGKFGREPVPDTHEDGRGFFEDHACPVAVIGSTTKTEATTVEIHDEGIVVAFADLIMVIGRHVELEIDL